MAQDLLLGVDIGTYETKGVLVTPQGKVVATAAVPHKMLFPHAGWAEHDPEKTWWGDFVVIVSELLKTENVTPADIKGIAVSAIGPCVCPVDADFNPLRMGILYGVDTRAITEIEELNAKWGVETLFNETAGSMSTQATGPKVMWIKKHEPENYENARWFLTSQSFVVARLTGRVVIDHFTAAGYSPMYDPWNNNWNPKYCEGIVPIEKLPELLWSDEIAGHITESAAAQTGLLVGTPVTVGTADAGAEALSVGVTKPGQMMMMYGSTIFIIQVTDNDQARDMRLWAAPYLFKGTWCLAAGMATSGSLTRWFRDYFAQDLIRAEENGGLSAYEVLVHEAEQTPSGAEGVIVLPYFSGERTPINDPRAKGIIFGLSLTHTRGHLFRGILEGIGYGVKQHIDLFDSIGARPTEIRAVGGGTKNRVWVQAVSDISNVPQQVSPLIIGAAYGDALLAGIATGLVNGRDEIYKWQAGGRVVSPDPSKKEIYQPLSSIYAGLYNSTKEFMHELHGLGY